MITDKVTVTHLPLVEPPAPASGGRIITGAGEMAQIVNGEEVRHLYYADFTVGGAPRGNHYHRRKHECVYIIEGKLEVVSIDLATKKQEKYVLSVGDLICSPPNNAHAYIPLEYTRAIVFAPEPFDAEDTIPYQVV